MHRLVRVHRGLAATAHEAVGAFRSLPALPPTAGISAARWDYRGQPGTTAANFRATPPTAIMNSPAPENGRIPAVVATLQVSNYEAELSEAGTTPSAGGPPLARKTRGSRQIRM
ncbi:hypothetical protein Axi01nite_85460 [Actinoplanes xinjiangensis]|nr:hypothetical protein Axi01nite_85460 [Actinoplanes xinjiangensis]